VSLDEDRIRAEEARSNVTRDELEAILTARVCAALAEHRRSEARALCVGVAAPQGAGKSTLCAALEARLAAAGLRAATLSVDDVYLTRAEQIAVAAAHAANPYLAVRGYPGTHDVALGVATLDRLGALREGERLVVPRYDKGAHGGAGDRAPREAWTAVEGPIDVVLFEGWMLAFEPAPPEAVSDDEHLALCNDRLRAYAPWRARVDRWIVLEAEALEDVVPWRVDAERARRAREGRGMSDLEARAYIERFLPAYRLWGVGAGERLAGVLASVRIGSDRAPLRLEREPPVAPGA
jgi:D-glycerate 3-kinase